MFYLKALPSCLNPVNLKIMSRFYSCRATCLTYKEYGEPTNVISAIEEDLQDPTADNVLVKLLAAPVNPADINTIQGKYPVKPKLPSIPGNEGLAEVVKVGEGVKGLSPGDRVVPNKNALGMWRTFGIFTETELQKVPKEMNLPLAATLTVNPCTAYRMIKDFQDLKHGETLIQNGANSACGQNVIQLCKAWGINSVNIVRNRPEIDKLKEYLMNLGASYVLTEEELRVTDIFKSKKIGKPKLALNCVGGKSGLELIRHLDNRGTIVTYGGMSREPVTIPTSALIFKDVKACGFWMTQWNIDNHDNPKRRAMYEELIRLSLNNELKPPSHEFVKFSNYKEALANALHVQGFVGKKILFDFNE